MRYPAEETAERHERILASASQLFRAHGFEGVSVAEVMKHAGLTHGGFYAHFGSKDDLAAAGLERALDEMLALADRSAGEVDPRAAFVRSYASRLHRDHPERGCAMTALAPEIARRQGKVRQAFTEKLGALVERATAAVRGRRRAFARQEALAMMAALVGAVILARAVDDPVFSDEILAAARAQYGVGPEA